MSLFRVAAPVNALNPVRTLAWNAALRAGDDLKIAFTLVDEDCETPIDVRSARALLTLYQEGIQNFWDYGANFSSYTDGPYSSAAAAVPGVLMGDNGRINFFLPAASSVNLCQGRYRAFITVDQPYGVSTEIEGLVQIHPHARNTLGNAGRQYFAIGQSGIGQALIPPRVIGGVPCDADGFPLVTWVPSPLPGVGVPGAAVLGQAVLGQMTLGSNLTTIGAN